ncbi:MAG: nuclear transport factor 2 family protein [Solirubrobacterales bacterium]
MESEQLRQLRTAFDAWNRGDWQETLSYMRKDVVWRTGNLMPDVDAVYEGHEGVRRFWRDFSEPWDEISIILEEILDEREAQLFVVVRFRARGREGIKVDMPLFQLYRYDDEGLLREFTGFAEEAEARRTAGLKD